MTLSIREEIENTRWLIDEQAVNHNPNSIVSLMSDSEIAETVEALKLLEESAKALREQLEKKLKHKPLVV